MSLFNDNFFGDPADEVLGQVVLPEPASDELIHSLATGVPSRTVEPGPESPADILKPSGAKATSAGGGMPTWAPYALVGGGVLFAGILIWSATRRPARATPNRRKTRRRRTRR